ncbi:relaxase/mobilization nuclease domain-containing protein [Pinibacter aurantiacus]|uniref:Relaxase/mobilization nuclease domain-containing protein n=1 Tax=Pinibacter aurantiacus TaxID=2851599 RepID=A0A9E2SCG3_9BACT|nr:relaxase/mobilization nuclease domain-containing protein [Pinibacter aurantiacus]MBV4357355.1 relaxase/mobilization nuclease domain-containing protein [Pinibacter aurantiacus]
MVAIINTSKSLRNVLNYNELKISENKALLIHSMNFGKDTEQLGFTDKLKTFEKLQSLNQRTQLSTTHISLNFDPSEKLSSEALQRIADAYMHKIGFGEQPYLVYQHHDAGHPHLHIVSTNIQKEGRAIKMFNIGRNQSEKARKEIEQEFKLVIAERKQKIKHELKPINVPKITYGKTETKRAISNVLSAVLTNYKYTSLPELNAVLKQYNVMADRGGENSRIYKSNGLVYRVLDEKGQKVGVPIKASLIYNNPGLSFLQTQFLKNEPLKLTLKPRIKNAIDLYFLQHKSRSIEGLSKNLQKENINVVLRQNEKGIIYGITYVDHQQKCVLNGSDLGKEYSANRIQERLNHPLSIKLTQFPLTDRFQLSNELISPSREPQKISTPATDLLQVLTQDEQQSSLNNELKNDDLRLRRKRKLRH